MASSLNGLYEGAWTGGRVNSGDLVEISSTEGRASTLLGFGVKFGVVGFGGC